MWKIYDTLSKYRLNDLSKLSPNLTEMSDTQLLAFTEDILSITELNTVGTETPPKGVNLCPIGGDFSLGNLQEISKQLLLYADHIVLEEPLSGLAKHTIETTKGNLQKLTSSREELVQKLHLLIRQLILIKPAIEQGIVALFHPSVTVRERALKLSDKIVHPELARIRHKLCEKAICFQQPNGILFFQFGEGSNRFLGVGGTIIKPELLLVQGKLPDTERDISLPDYPDWAPPKGSTKISGRSIERNTQSAKIFDTVVNHIIARVVLGMHIAQLNESNYMTDDPIEWEVTKLLSRIDEEQRRVSISEHISHAFSIQIARELAFLDNVNLDDILKVRNNYKDEFAAFRNSLSDLFERIQEVDISDWDKLHNEAKKTVSREISPAILNIKTVFANVQRQRWLDTTVKFGIAALSISASIRFPDPQIQPWIGNPPIPLLEVRKLQRTVKTEQLRKRPMYFLWQVMRRAKQ